MKFQILFILTKGLNSDCLGISFPIILFANDYNFLDFGGVDERLQTRLRKVQSKRNWAALRIKLVASEPDDKTATSKTTTDPTQNNESEKSEKITNPA